jgi:hypothetical protein
MKRNMKIKSLQSNLIIMLTYLFVKYYYSDLRVSLIFFKHFRITTKVFKKNMALNF